MKRLLGLALALHCAAAWAAADMPFEDARLHLGVGTCSGSNCHGSSVGLEESPVLQNEYYLWSRKDAHSNAYKLLFTDEGKRIARNLGIKAAHEEKACLVCHTDYVPADKRGRRYTYNDGVGCEACHGPAQEYLGSHVSGVATHADNLADGLFPLEDPVQRAELCLHCHLGSAERPIDHRIMGAGHPPLVFELDTFTAIQPAHFRVDADYIKRKGAVSNAMTWALGQMVAARMQLDGLAGPRNQQLGVFPELVFYDCNACHHPMKPPRWNAGLAGTLGPGEVRLHDAHLSMTAHVLEALGSEQSQRWSNLSEKLHKASSRSVAAVREISAEMRELVAGEARALQGRKLDRASVLALVRLVARDAGGRNAGDFTAAQQTQMAMDAFAATLEGMPGGQPAGMKPALDLLFEAVDTRVNYDVAKFQKAIAGITTAVGR